ncbi:hypothetical protein BT69DRAFT_1356002 [Atractiella rhizophila]|nr:hypothetical protein BT69DRAFT_1356002 [Atractiella rhizophila]
MTSLAYDSLLQGEEEQVEVNQRALIDKVLARYSGEFTVYRELIQNASDAGASHVSVHFTSAEELTELPSNKDVKIKSIVVKNDGAVFTNEDWTRLRRIADGNPNEESIGAYGVGYYSVFGLTDNPVVRSGSNAMLFYYPPGKDQLYVRRAQLPADAVEYSSHDSTRPLTMVEMAMREHLSIPNPEDFTRFLATAITFAAHLKTLTCYLDKWKLCEISKKLDIPKPIPIPRTLRADVGFMKVDQVKQTGVEVNVEFLKWVLQVGASSKISAKKEKDTLSTSLLKDGLSSKMLRSAFFGRSAKPPPTPVAPAPPKEATNEPATSKMFFKVVSASVAVTVSSQFDKEINRATKKSPPKRTELNIVYFNADEYRASSQQNNNAVFSGLAADLSTQGRIFIGFPTHQTTGFPGPMSGRFIPTVERESLDLSNKWVADWNRALLGVGGFLTRMVYEEDMKDIQRLWNEVGEDDDGPKEWLRSRGLHALKFFSFKQSTPSSLVSLEIEENFFACDPRRNLPIITNKGVVDSNKARLPNKDVMAFVKNIPWLEVEDDVLDGLRTKQLVKECTLDDILAEFRARPLSLEEGSLALKWWLGLSANEYYRPSLLAAFIDSVMILLPSGEPLPISSIKTFLNPKHIPTDMPMPQDTLPYEVSKGFSDLPLLQRVFSWRELLADDYVAFLLSEKMTGSGAPVETNMLASPHFAEKVFGLLSRTWNNLPSSRAQLIVSTMADKAVVPTKQGFKRPPEAYFANVNLFEDLPIIQFPTLSVKGPLEKLLQDLGCLKHVELQLVFSRLVGAGSWSHVEMTKYLISVKDNLTNNELEKLRKTKWLPVEKLAANDDSKKDEGQKRPVRFVASELYEPLDILRSLGLPVLEWPAGKWRSTSIEAKFLQSLGLLRHPPIDVILRLASDETNSKLRSEALAYFLTHWTAAGYDRSYDPLKTNHAFVPARLGDGKTGHLAPRDVFTNATAQVMGFGTVLDWLRPEVGKLKLKADPDPAALLRKLLTEPPTVETATTVFTYLSSQLSAFSSRDLSTLRSASLIPVSKEGKTVYTPPSECYFSGDRTSLPSQFKSLFNWVNFGETAKPFLTAVGVKEEPNIQEICKLMVEDPVKMYRLAGSSEAYVGVLRSLAANWSFLSSPLRMEMGRSAFFLGCKRVQAAPVGNEDDEEEEEATFHYKLLRPSDVLIVDENSAYSPFSGDVYVCPQEDILEMLAEGLGAQRLSKVLKNSYRVEGQRAKNPKTTDMRKLVIERSALFLYERQQQSKKEIAKDAEWIRKHLEVVQVSNIENVRTLVHNGDRFVRTQHLTACTLMEQGAMVLFLAGREIDYYEVASSLCKLILTRQRMNDALLFMTLLQTSVKNLKRRGFNVDRLLNARRLEKEVEDQRNRELELQAQLEAAQALSPSRLDDLTKQLCSQFPDADPTFVRNLLSAQKQDHARAAQKVLEDGNYPRQREPSPDLPSMPGGMGSPSDGGGLFSGWRKRLQGIRDSRQGSTSAALPPPPPYDDLDKKPSTSSSNGRDGTNGIKTPLPDPNAEVTPTNDIKSQVLKAIQASRPDATSDSIQGDAISSEIKEQDHYCDSSAATNLHFVADLHGMRFFVDASCNPEEVIEAHSKALSRFVNKIAKPIGEVFQMNPKSLNIFYDTVGPLIAFNRNRSIYLNLRYYIGWHDALVASGDLVDPLISWAHTVAHELAHNLESIHNSRHEFYFSSICEQYFVRLAALVASSAPPSSSSNPSSSNKH